MTILDLSMSLERIEKNLGVSGVVDMRQLLLKSCYRMYVDLLYCSYVFQWKVIESKVIKTSHLIVKYSSQSINF